MDETRQELEQLIAPCGMNCRLCMAYQRKKKHCNGCNMDDTKKSSISCLRCIIKNCPTIQHNKSKFCYECEKYPCLKLRQLDMRYRKKYHMSMLENLESIKQNGLTYFINQEEIKWTCPKCESILCVHRSICPKCHFDFIGESDMIEK